LKLSGVLAALREQRLKYLEVDRLHEVGVEPRLLRTPFVLLVP
jgi:hypothetical protein